MVIKTMNPLPHTQKETKRKKKKEKKKRLNKKELHTKTDRACRLVS
jgi:hypothetical protein